jgi:hypothetical protein
MVLLAVVGAGMLAALLLHRFWLRQLTHLTGDAQWVWVTDVLEHVHPEAGLFVASLHLNSPPGAALLKVCGDREYVVYVNDTPAACGWSRPGFRLDIYDVGHLLRQGENVIVAEVRSPTPAGGLLLALDVDGVGRNVLVSGPAFRARTHFSLGPIGPADVPIPVDWGVPPRFPWGYPYPQSHPRTLDDVVVEEPLRIERGLAHHLRGGGWEFVPPQPVFGYLWVEFDSDGLDYLATSETSSARPNLVALRRSAQPIVRLRGQHRWLDPEPRLIGAVFVFGQHWPSAVELWPVAERFRLAAPGVVQGQHGLVPRTRWTTRTPPE